MGRTQNTMQIFKWFHIFKCDSSLYVYLLQKALLKKVDNPDK